MADKALFLDRDGVINVDHAYVYKPEEFEFVDGIFDLCRFFASQGYRLFIITNQAGIGRGFYTEADFASLMEWVEAEFKKQGVCIEKSYFCPHHPKAGLGEYKTACDCRKPEPGMIFKAQQEFGLDLSQSLLIGDKISDIEAADRAGLKKGYLIKSQYQDNYDFASVRDMYQHLEKGL